jgi:hypothetical protein
MSAGLSRAIEIPTGAAVAAVKPAIIFERRMTVTV